MIRTFAPSQSERNGRFVRLSESPPAAVAPPRIPDAMARTEVRTAPEAIALTRADLPAGFEKATEKRSGTEYAALFLRPTALEEQASGGNSLLSVLTNIAVYTSTTQAADIFAEASIDNTQQTIAELTSLNTSVSDISIEPFAGAVQGADDSEAFHVAFKLLEQDVFQYGYRFRIGNVLAYVVVAAIGRPDEPQNFRKSARDIVQRQIDHLVESTSTATPAK